MSDQPDDKDKKDEPPIKSDPPTNPDQAPKPESPQKPDVNINNASISDSQMNIGDNNKQTTINKIINNWGEKSFKIHRFSVEEDSYPLSKEEINAVEQIIVFPPEILNEWICSLKENRILLLTGETDSGKYITTKYLCFLLMQEPQTNYDARYIPSLTAITDIDLLKLFNNKKNLSQKILIFKNVFAKKNQNIINFLDSCASTSIGSILKELDTFIIFTADTGTFDNYRLASLKITKEIFYLDYDLLQKGFDNKLYQFCSQSDKRDFTQAAQRFENNKKEIIGKLGRMSKISSFIEYFLDKIMVEGKPIEEAVEEVIDIRKHLEHWFMKELGMNEKEFETWTFALCLALFNNSDYIVFNEIHREISMMLLRQMDPFKTLKGFTFTLSESELLENCKAEITRVREKEWQPYSDRINFCDPRYQKELLNVLLSNNRKILLFLIPFLEKYIETHDSIDRNRFAAISLARIGVMSPQTIIFPIIAKWAQMQNPQWENVGYLYEGIFDSEDEDYKKYCMRILNAMAFNEDIETQWTAIAAYKQIGLHDLDFALDELRKIQEVAIERLDKKQDEKIMDFLYSETESVDTESLLANLDRIYKETDDLLSYIRYAIVSLSTSIIFQSISLDPIDVIYELRKWSFKGNRNSRANVVLIFMGPQGILDALEYYAIVSSEKNNREEEENSNTNLLLYALAAGEEQVKKMVTFLKELYTKCFSEFPMNVKKELKKLMFERIKKWTLESLSDDKIENAVKNLIIRFYKSGDDEMKDTLWDAVNQWKVPKEKEDKLEEKLNTFVDDIAKQIFYM